MTEDRQAWKHATEATLIACGEKGYPEVTVQHVLERSGCSRIRFYRLFNSKADCYAQAYEAEIERLCGALLQAAAREQSWRAGLRTALADLALYIALRPATAKGLLVEVHSAGEPALAKRTQMIARLTGAVDLARKEADCSLSPPSITAEFLVCAIEAAAVRALTRNEVDRFAKEVPELAHLIVVAYFGKEAAREDMAAWRVS
jgi:AcrR family transcriptional regulator